MKRLSVVLIAALLPAVSQACLAAPQPIAGAKYVKSCSYKKIRNFSIKQNTKPKKITVCNVDMKGQSMTSMKLSILSRELFKGWKPRKNVVNKTTGDVLGTFKGISYRVRFVGGAK